MTHPRKLIREAAKAALIAASTIAGDNVQSNRPNPLSQNPSARSDRKDLPRIIVYTRNVKSEVFDESPRRYRHVAELVVEGALEVTGAVEDIDDELDDFEASITEALLRDDTLDDTADDLVLTGASMAMAEAGAKLVGAVIITLDATYYTDAPTAGDADGMDNFSTIHTEHSLAGQQGGLGDEPSDRAQTDISDLEAQDDP